MAMLIALPAFLCLSCKSKSSDYADDHLAPKVMQQVLKDITVAEAYSTIVKDSLHKGGMKNTDSLAGYYKDIFAHYHITQEQFSESLDWYKDHATEMDTIYANLIPIITKLQVIFPAPAVKLPNTPNPLKGA